MRRCFLYWWEGLLLAVDGYDGRNTLISLAVAGVILGVRRFGLGVDDVVVVKWFEFAAFAWAGVSFFFWIPFKRHQELKEELERLRQAGLRIEGIACDILDRGQFPWPYNCRLKLTNVATRTAENVRVELREIGHEQATADFGLPFGLAFEAAGSIHPGGEAIVKFARASMELEQTSAGLEKRIEAGFGPNPPGFFLRFKTDRNYRVRIKAMAQDFPPSESTLDLRFASIDGPSWLFTLMESPGDGSTTN